MNESRLPSDAERPPLPERHTVELAAGSVVIERYHWEKSNGRRGVQWLAQVVDRDGNLTLYKVCKTRVEALMVALERGCYGCGHWPVKFGGTVQPAIFDRFLNILEPESALWWTDCPKCGRIEVTE